MFARENQKMKTNSNNYKKYLEFVLMLGVLMLTACMDKLDTQDLVKVQIGEKVPHFNVSVTLPDSSDWRFEDGKVVDYDSYANAGRRQFIMFFHTACSDCQRELPVIQEFYSRHKGENVISFVCIARAESDADIMDYWCSNGLTLPYSPQADRRIFDQFADSGIPRIYVTDSNGFVTSIFTDRDKLTLEMLESSIETTR